MFAPGAYTKASLTQITELDNCANTVATCARSMTNLFFLMRGLIFHDQKGHFTVIKEIIIISGLGKNLPKKKCLFTSAIYFILTLKYGSCLQC